jgi:hypothetical protein
MVNGATLLACLAFTLLLPVSGRTEGILNESLRGSPETLRVRAHQPAEPGRPDLPAEERLLLGDELGTEARRFEVRADEGREFTWWLPPQADAYILPLSAPPAIRPAKAPGM